MFKGFNTELIHYYNFVLTPFGFDKHQLKKMASPILIIYPYDFFEVRWTQSEIKFIYEFSVGCPTLLKHIAPRHYPTSTGKMRRKPGDMKENSLVALEPFMR
ncbi:hypothetical protein VIBNISOn1_p0023 [Vibrio nigripulchritudo SOn1]|uniref:Transposase n=1 Tax=Vibrio nigripulchritudo SOn1 TaxID=1238450 RepID=A0AAV2VZI2_9VIBR|nr:hypothetical protein VIBNISOn1_p0023 [Vibrio nigripulchritudo SOn1]